MFTHHVVHRAVNSVVLFQQLLDRSGPRGTKKTNKLNISVFSPLTEQTLRRLQQTDTHLKAALRVLFFLTKAILTRPSHSFSGDKEH